MLIPVAIIVMMRMCSRFNSTDSAHTRVNNAKRILPHREAISRSQLTRPPGSKTSEATIPRKGSQAEPDAVAPHVRESETVTLSDTCMGRGVNPTGRNAVVPTRNRRMHNVAKATGHLHPLDAMLRDE